MFKRASATLTICALTAGVAVIGLARSPADTSATAPTETHTEVAAAEPSTESPASGSAAIVTIESFTFGGTTVAGPGQTLTVENLDVAPHTLTARNGAFDSGTIQPGESGTLTLPTEPGSYEFFCTIHPSMVSTITVEA